MTVILEVLEMRAPASHGVAAATLPTWAHATCPSADHTQVPARCINGHFPYDHAINERLILWQGDITTLQVDAITNPIDDSLLDSNPVSERIFAAAGPGLRDEVISRSYESPRSVFVTGAGALPCGRVLHAPLPAAHHDALLHCYTSILEKCRELGCRSLALPVLYSRPALPADITAHAALYAIRRHLQNNTFPNLVVVVSKDAGEVRTITPHYFPCGCRGCSQRNTRRIRIIHNPHIDTAEDESSSYESEAAAEAAAALARACDTQRLLAPESRDTYLDTRHDSRDLRGDRYDRLLRRAHLEDLSEVSGIGCLYQSGVDRLGRPVVVFIGKWFPIGDIDLDKALLYLIKLLDPVVQGDYVIAYFHTLASSGNHPPFSWLKEVYTVLPYKYKKNLKAFYIVHPTFWTKMMTWWFTTFMAPAIKAKVHSLPGVEYLYSVMPRDQLELPAFITEYDMTINGLHYFQPDTNNT